MRAIESVTSHANPEFELSRLRCDRCAFMVSTVLSRVTKGATDRDVWPDARLREYLADHHHAVHEGKR